MIAQKNKREPIETLLAGIPLFAQLDHKALSRLAKSAVEIAAPRGTMIFSRGDACTGLHAITFGRVKLALPAPDHPEKVIALLGASRTLGESAMFLHEPHMLSAETLCDTKLVHLPRAAVLACMARDPAFACQMAQALSRRQRELIAEIESSTQLSGTERVVRFILGEVAPDTGNGAAAITLPAKKHVIASRLDLTHEHFSRILHDLTAARMIVVEGARIKIPDVRKLRSFPD